MSDLAKLKNIGVALASRLNAVGINSAEELRELGSKEAFIRLRVNEPDSCINALMALEGAIQDVRWHHLDDEVKRDLKAFYNARAL